MSHEEGYIPKHLKIYDDAPYHCCFSGCAVGSCGCCTRLGWHRESCEFNATRQFENAQHDIYVQKGLRKHLRSDPDVKYTPSLDWGAFPVLRLLDDR